MASLTETKEVTTSEPARSARLAIAIGGVSKRFGDATVIHDVDLEVGRGELFGLIGPSGCGKSTLMRMLVGLLRPSDGELRVNDVEPSQFSPADRQRIGYMPQGFALYENLSLEDNARFVGGIYGLGWFERRRRVRAMLDLLELWPDRRKAARDVSGGMQRRLSLACALLHRPSLLFVDEPSAGLDPVLRAKIWDHLDYLREGGTTVFVTTQHIDEASRCERVAIMRDGAVLATGTPEDLRVRAAGGEAVEIMAAGLRPEDVQALWSAPGVRRVHWEGGDRVRLVAEDSAVASPVATEVLRQLGLDVGEVRVYVPTFEDVFMALVQDRKGVLR